MKDLSTEQKIIEAAGRVFTRKGFAATRTRDIAVEAGINLALLNYYFKSKENLFNMIIKKNFEKIFEILTPILSDENVSLEEKVKTLVNNYTTLMMENEDLPLFVLNEMRNNNQIFNQILRFARNASQPVIEKQLKESEAQMSVADFVMNVVGMTIFPFIAKPLIEGAGLLKDEDFNDFVLQRKEHIPSWIDKLIK